MNIRGVIAIAVTTMLLAACGDDGNKRAEEAASSLRGMRVDGPPNTVWRLVDTRVANGIVYLDVGIDSGTAVAMRAVSRMQSSQIAQRACPSASAKVWKILEDTQEVWVHLIDDKEALVVDTRCKRP